VRLFVRLSGAAPCFASFVPGDLFSQTAKNHPSCAVSNYKAIHTLREIFCPSLLLFVIGFVLDSDLEGERVGPTSAGQSYKVAAHT